MPGIESAASAGGKPTRVRRRDAPAAKPPQPSAGVFPVYKNGIIPVDLRRADELVPYPRNARKHTDAHIAEVMGSILEFGWTAPILADDFIRAGHARTKAALRIYEQGRTIRLPNGTELPPGMVPVIDCTGWTDAQKRAYVLADNKLTENADWDEDLLRLELGELKGLHAMMAYLRSAPSLPRGCV